MLLQDKHHANTTRTPQNKERVKRHTHTFAVYTKPKSKPKSEYPEIQARSKPKPKYQAIQSKSSQKQKPKCRYRHTVGDQATLPLKWSRQVPKTIPVKQFKPSQNQNQSANKGTLWVIRPHFHSKGVGKFQRLVLPSFRCPDSQCPFLPGVQPLLGSSVGACHTLLWRGVSLEQMPTRSTLRICIAPAGQSPPQGCSTGQA